MTMITHDTENPIDVEPIPCSRPGCYERNIAYNAPDDQIKALIEQSEECHQSIKV